MSERDARPASPLFAAAYMGFMALSVLYPYFRIVSLPWFTMHVCYVAIIGMALVWVFVTGRLGRVKTALAHMAVFGWLYLFLLGYSLCVWIANLDGMSVIRRGASTIAYQLLGIVTVGAAYVLFGKRTVFYTFWGYVAGNCLLVLNAIVTIGLGDFISQMLSFYLSFGGEDTAASTALEIHDLTFAFGEFVIFFWLFGKGRKGRMLCLILSIGFLLLGWKRIAIPGILIAGVFVHFMRKKPPHRAKQWTGGLGLALVAVGYMYLIIIRSGLYADVCNSLGIDTMGRIELLRFIETYYDLSPLFAGHGIGFITRMMQDFIESGQAVLNAAMSIHNDILARYIELGFMGFAVWALGLFWLTPRVVGRLWTQSAMLAFFSCLIYCFLTYLTDNTAGYYHINFCLRLIPLAFAAEGPGAKGEAKA